MAGELETTVGERAAAEYMGGAAVTRWSSRGEIGLRLDRFSRAVFVYG
jgi:hypothetical protein